MRWFYRLLHYFSLGRAISRGPAGTRLRVFARYEVRRQGRKALYRATRRRRRF